MTVNDTFTCSICGEPSDTICRYCTHDACANHLCERCGRCSDCCSCDIHNRAEAPEAHTHSFTNGHVRHAGEPGPADLHVDV